ncbi:MAG: hypothetical protein O9353_05840, partial [Bacteroidia bacterium]|nr:hypothetical protein [Bacteroidia bacterium]
MGIVGVIISFILDFIVQSMPHDHNRFFDILTSVTITIVVWEGNLRIDHWMNLKFPWEKNPGNRILFQLPVSIIFSAGLIYISMLAFNAYVCEMPASAKEAFVSIAVIIGVMVSIILLSVEIGIQFFGNWRSSLVEVEKYKTESLQAQLQNLKNQINP